jgi:hypothetical protein
LKYITVEFGVTNLVGSKSGSKRFAKNEFRATYQQQIAEAPQHPKNQPLPQAQSVNWQI